MNPSIIGSLNHLNLEPVEAREVQVGDLLFEPVGTPYYGQRFYREAGKVIETSHCDEYDETYIRYIDPYGGEDEFYTDPDNDVLVVR